MYTPKQIRNHLQKLQDNWNGRYWLFATPHSLHLMKYKKGQAAILPDGGIDPAYIVCSYNIPVDGGDW